MWYASWVSAASADVRPLPRYAQPVYPPPPPPVTRCTVRGHQGRVFDRTVRRSERPARPLAVSGKGGPLIIERKYTPRVSYTLPEPRLPGLSPVVQSRAKNCHEIESNVRHGLRLASEFGFAVGRLRSIRLNIDKSFQNQIPRRQRHAFAVNDLRDQLPKANYYTN